MNCLRIRRSSLPDRFSDCTLGGKRKRDSDMVFGIPFLIASSEEALRLQFIAIIYLPSAHGILRAQNARDQPMYLEVVVLLRLSQPQLFP